jgi:hypothetical protein
LEFPLEHLFLSFHGLDPIISTHDVTLLGVFGRAFSSQETNDFATLQYTSKNERYLKVKKAVSSTSSMSVFQRYFNVVENETRVSST